MTDRERRRRRAIRQRQKRLRAEMMKSLMLQTVIVFIVMITALSNVSSKAEETSAEQDAQVEHESVAINNTMQNLDYDYQVTTKASEEVKEPEVEYYPAFTYSKDWDANDSYLLAKIAMCEAGNQNTQTKTLVIMTILNRVWDNRFPDTIEEVIFQQNSNGVYQFSPIGDGSWEKNEPDEDCWEAVRIVMESKYDYSGGALYFESCENKDNWFSRNLEFLYQSQALRFYK